MKNVIFTFLFITLWVSKGQAQTTTEVNSNTLAETASQELCKCMNSFFNEFHPEIIVFLNEMMEIGEEKAQENFSNYFMRASSEDIIKITEDLEKMENSDALLDERCEEVGKKYDAYKEPEFEEAFMNALSKRQECRLVWMIMNISSSEKP